MARRAPSNRTRSAPPSRGVEKSPQQRTRELREDAIRKREANPQGAPTWTANEQARQRLRQELDALEAKRLKEVPERLREEERRKLREERERKMLELREAQSRAMEEAQARLAPDLDEPEARPTVDLSTDVPDGGAGRSRLPIPDEGETDSELARQQRGNAIRMRDLFYKTVYTPPYGAEGDYIYAEQPLGLPSVEETVLVVYAGGQAYTQEEALAAKLIQFDPSTGGYKASDTIFNPQTQQLEAAPAIEVNEIVTYRVKRDNKPRDPYEQVRFDLFTRVKMNGGNPTLEDYATLAEIERSERTNALDVERYLQDSEDPLSENAVIDTLYQMPVSELAALKSNLARVGLLPTEEMGSLFLRDVNAATVEAFSTLASLANQNDIEWQSLMDTSLDTNQSLGSYNRPTGGGSGSGGMQIRLTNPDDLKTVANQVAQQRLGRRLDDISLDQFVTSYQQAETDFQQQYLSGAATVTEAPSVDVAAGTQIEQQFAEEEDLYSLGGAIDTFTKLIGE